MTPSADRQFMILNASVSAAAVAFLGWLLFLRQAGGTEADLSFIPAVNASLNAAAATLLIAGFVAIKRGKRDVHKRLMVTAFIVSGVFLIGYVIYHYAHGDTPYTGQGAIRTVYFTILISHVVLSMSVLPLALTAVYLAWRKRFEAHKKVTRWALPIWLYVSVTGVVIFFMLR